MKIEHKNQNHEGNNPNLRDVNRVASVRKKVRKKGKKNKKEMRLNRTELKEKNKKRLGTEVRVNHPVAVRPFRRTISWVVSAFVVPDRGVSVGARRW
jgi:hypothetical protein